MDEIQIPSNGLEPRVRQQLLAQHGGPAYLRRARQVDEAFETILQHCRQQRDKWLLVTRVRLGLLRALAGTWDALLPWLADAEQMGVLENLFVTLQPHVRQPIQPTTSPRVLRRALNELVETLHGFNERWQTFLQSVDLGRVNELRENYNRYYLLEKECAVRSIRTARQGFQRLPPATAQDLLTHLPPLPVPRLQER